MEFAGNCVCGPRLRPGGGCRTPELIARGLWRRLWRHLQVGGARAGSRMARKVDCGDGGLLLGGVVLLRARHEELVLLEELLVLLQLLQLLLQGAC